MQTGQPQRERTNVNRIRTILALLAVTAVAAAAIGAPASAGSRTENDIVATAASAGQFKTLTKLLGRAGLVSALRQPGPYTVFAPTDAAFKKVPKKTLASLLRNKAKLKAVLLYHVVSGKVAAPDVMASNGVIHVVNRVLIPPAR
jgi:uncharacterized surface protein with fasciclin (FAS1) repeats